MKCITSRKFEFQCVVNDACLLCILWLRACRECRCSTYVGNARRCMYACRVYDVVCYDSFFFIQTLPFSKFSPQILKMHHDFIAQHSLNIIFYSFINNCRVEVHWFRLFLRNFSCQMTIFQKNISPKIIKFRARKFRRFSADGFVF